MMTSLKDELERVEMGEPLHYRNLTLFPLLRQPAASDVDYSLLGDAIHQGLARVTELNGEVPFRSCALRTLVIDQSSCWTVRNSSAPSRTGYST